MIRVEERVYLSILALQMQMKIKNKYIFEVKQVDGRGAFVFISSAKSTTLEAYHSQENTLTIIKEYWCAEN